MPIIREVYQSAERSYVGENVKTRKVSFLSKYKLYLTYGYVCFSEGNLECLSLEQKELRVKFGTVWKGGIEALAMDSQMEQFYTDACTDMAEALWELEECGVTPVLPDGKVGGNAAAILEFGGQRHLLVSKSGKMAGQKMDITHDTCVVTNFDSNTWAADFLSKDPTVLPTSDTPMHFTALNAHINFNWSDIPGAALHGHALETEEEAEKFHLPISTEESLFSTPEDTQALLDLMFQYPYPQNRVFIRKGHGFYILGKDIKDAMKTFYEKVKPYMKN